MVKLIDDIFDSFPKESKNEEQLSMNIFHMLFFVMFMYPVEALILILYYIQKRNTIRKNKKGIRFLPKSLCEKLKVLLIISVLCIVDCSSTIGLIGVNNTKILSFLEMILKGIVLIIATLLSMLILHYKYYKHHWLGCTIIFIGLILFTFNDFVTNWNAIIQISNSFKDIIITIFLSYIWVAFQEVLEIYLMDVKFVSPFVVIGLEGVVGMITITVGTIIYCLIYINSCDFFNKYGEYFIRMYTTSKMRLVWYILLLVGLFSFNTFKVLTNDAYYPTYKGLSDVFGHFFRWVVLILIGSDKTNFTFRLFFIKILSYVIMMMGIIIYLEIIQLNFCGFNKKTRKEITIRTLSDISIDSIIPMIDTEKENKEIKDENINYENKENEDLF